MRLDSLEMGNRGMDSWTARRTTTPDPKKKQNRWSPIEQAFLCRLQQLIRASTSASWKFSGFPIIHAQLGRILFPCGAVICVHRHGDTTLDSTTILCAFTTTPLRNIYIRSTLILRLGCLNWWVYSPGTNTQRNWCRMIADSPHILLSAPVNTGRVYPARLKVV